MTEAEINYRALLIMYIDHINHCEGFDYLTPLRREDSAAEGLTFTDAEWAALDRMARIGCEDTHG